MTETNVYIIRHCKAEGQAPDAQLTEQGREQADKLARFLSAYRIDRIVSSPYARAVHTAKPLAEQLRLDVVTDERLTERILCGEDRPDWLELLRRTFDDLELRYEGGESSREAMSRAVGLVEEHMSDASPYRNVAIVSHGNLISLLLKHFDCRFGFKEWERLSNPDVYRLTVSRDHNGHIPVIRRLWNP